MYTLWKCKTARILTLVNNVATMHNVTWNDGFIFGEKNLMINTWSNLGKSPGNT